MYYIDIYIDMNKLYRSYFYPLKPPIKTLFHQKTTQVACFLLLWSEGDQHHQCHKQQYFSVLHQQQYDQHLNHQQQLKYHFRL